MGAREELAAVLTQHREDYDSDCGMHFGCFCDWDNGTDEHNNGYTEHVADAILASPALARLLDEARREALREAADAWPREINAETFRRYAASLDDAEVPEYRVDTWLRDRADEIGGDGDA